MKIQVSLLFILSIICFSCTQDIMTKNDMAIKENQTVAPQAEKRAQHPYGGWYCPDNFGGFPPVDIMNLDEVPVVVGRLPTEEETRSGKSLMHIDLNLYPDAKPLSMGLPRAARIYSDHSKMEELIIVIQAVVIGQDTVVGFRYPSGGNGSSWYDEVEFLSDEEVDELGSRPYVYFNKAVDASQDDIWRSFIQTEYAKNLGSQFSQEKFFSSLWPDRSSVKLSFETDSVRASGIALKLWGNIYVQVDYKYDGFQYSEKMLILEDRNSDVTHLHFVAGPYTSALSKHHDIWDEWTSNVKHNSEHIKKQE